MFESNKFLCLCLNKKVLCGTHFPNTDYASLEFIVILKVEIHISSLLLFFTLLYCVYLCECVLCIYMYVYIYIFCVFIHKIHIYTYIYSVVSPRQTLSAVVQYNIAIIFRIFLNCSTYILLSFKKCILNI